MKHYLVSIIGGLAVLLLLNWASGYLYRRFDMTEDKRYTLTDAAKQTAKQFESPVIVDVLLDGNIPAEFNKLKIETALLLEQFKTLNNNITYNLADPLEDAELREQTITDLQQLGLEPARVTIEEDGKVLQELVFPWAMVTSRNKTIKVPLLKNKLGSTLEERINNSVQQLEYAFADAFAKLNLKKKKKIAVIKGNGPLEDRYLVDYLSSIREYYNIGAITLDSVATNAQDTFEQLKKFDLALIAKPTEAFSDGEKYVLDQFVVNGGKSIWLIDQVNMELDSLFNKTGSNVATLFDLKLNDFFFRYGVRINPVLVNDLYNTPIVLATGDGNDSQYNPLPWVYHPMVFSKENHPINKNIEAIRLQFANTIDTLPNTNKKTILLQSSVLSKPDGVPKTISLDVINQKPDQEQYHQNGNLPLAVLIEGAFSSAYKNRIKPVALHKTLEDGPENKMLVIADGDIVKNQLRNGQPLELGFDKWTSSFYGNKEFLVNCINYMLDDTGLINIRSKNVAIPLLDSKKIAEQKTKWQLINIGLPVVLAFILGISFSYYRKQRFMK